MVAFHHSTVSFSFTRFDYLTFMTGVVELKAVLEGRNEIINLKEQNKTDKYIHLTVQLSSVWFTHLYLKINIELSYWFSRVFNFSYAKIF